MRFDVERAFLAAHAQDLDQARDLSAKIMTQRPDIEVRGYQPGLKTIKELSQQDKARYRVRVISLRNVPSAVGAPSNTAAAVY
jgi:hypothetical protein